MKQLSDRYFYFLLLLLLFNQDVQKLRLTEASLGHNFWGMFIYLVVLPNEKVVLNNY